MSDVLRVIPSRGDLDWCWYLRRLGQNGEALERVLHDIGVMQPGGWADWQPSTMTDTGAPVEMLFSANQSGLSLRTEVDDPGKTPSSRTTRVCDLMAKLGGGPPPAALRDVICAAQSAADLRFGAWLGLTQSAHRLDMTLYAELPGDVLDLVGRLPVGQSMPVLETLGDHIKATMLGYDALCDATTLFFETALEPHDIIPQLVVPAQVSPVPLLRHLGGLQQLGFSYTFGADRSHPLLTLHISAKDLFGTDALAAEQVRARLGDPVGAYAVLVDELAPTSRGRIQHGEIGLKARKEADPHFAISVAAPWVCPFEMY